MDLGQVEELVGTDETDRLELKKSTGQLKSAMHALCGFLNGDGGWVIIGVTPDRRTVGQQVSDSTLQTIAAELRKFEPPAPIILERISTRKPNHEVLVFKADPAGESRPYIYDGRAYQRIGPTDSVMPQAKYERLLLERAHGRRRWENAEAEGYNIEDLDEEEILKTMRVGVEQRRVPESVERDPRGFLSRLKLLSDGVPLNAAVVLFGRRFMPDFPQCELRMARFRGTDKSEFLDDRQTRGHLFGLLDEAILFLERHLPVKGIIEPGSLERIETLAFPPDALREALVNALCHREYSLSGGSVRLAIYDDRLEIWSDGGLPPGLTVDDLSRDHPSLLRNPIIADVLYRRGLVERWGRGTQKIIELCLEEGHPRPEFIERAGSVGVRFLSRGYVPPLRIAYDLTDRQREILDIVSSTDEIPFRQIRERLSDPPADRTIRDDLAFLKGMGLIDSRGFGRGAVWYLVRKEAENKAERGGE